MAAKDDPMKTLMAGTNDDDGGDDSDDSLPSLTDVFAKERQRRALARAEANLTHADTELLVDNKTYEGGLNGAGTRAAGPPQVGEKLVQACGKDDNTTILS